MGFSIFQFNKKKLYNLMFGENGINVNCGDLGLLNEILDKYNSLPKYDINQDGKLFVWINYDVLMSDFPVLSTNIGTYRNVCRKLEKLGLIEKEDKAIKLQGGDCKKKTFFRPTELTLSLVVTEKDVKTQTEEQIGLEPVEEAPVTQTVEVKKPAKKRAKKEQAEKIEVLEGQITVEEAIAEAEKAPTTTEKINVETIVKATQCNINRAEEVLNYAIECNKNNPVGFAISAIKGNWELKGKDTVEINARSFNNFEAREYDYDSLEKKLLKWDNEEEPAESTTEKSTFLLEKFGIGAGIKTTV